MGTEHARLLHKDMAITQLGKMTVELHRQVLVLARQMWMFAEPGSRTEQDARAALREAGLVDESGRPLPLAARSGDQEAEGFAADLAQPYCAAGG